jgi:hypothetical protein
MLQPWNPCDALAAIAKALQRLAETPGATLPDKLWRTSTKPSYALTVVLTLPGMGPGSAGQAEMLRRWLQANGQADAGRELYKRLRRIQAQLRRWELVAANDTPPDDSTRFFSDGVCERFDAIADESADLANYCQQLAAMLKPKLKLAAGQPATKAGERKRPKLPKLGPHDMQAWQLSVLQGWKQQRIADELNAEHGTTYVQWRVSRMIKNAQLHADASRIAELIPPKAAPAKTINPAKLDLGKRVDGLTPRQRAKSKPKSED